MYSSERAFLYTKFIFHHANSQKKNIPGPGWNTVDKLKSNIMVFYGKVYAASIPLSHHFDMKTFFKVQYHQGIKIKAK